MPADPRPPQPRSGYATGEVTKAPNWHGLVAWDLLFNNLTTGLFLVAAIGELAAPAALGPPARAAYPLALALLVADLICLVLDLGNPSRFHHMLRVFKPSSPMSLGTWCLTVYSLPLTLTVAIDLLPALHLMPAGAPAAAGLGWARRAALIGGLLPALGSAVYKGVLFSTSAQPAWKDARWLGGYLVNSAITLGCAELLALAVLLGHAPAADRLRPALGPLLALNAATLFLLIADLLPALVKVHTRGQLIRLGSIAIGVGLLAPLGLVLGSAGPVAMLAALAGLLAGSLAVRFAIVKLPHAAHGTGLAASVPG